MNSFPFTISGPKNSIFVITNSSTLWDFNHNQNYWSSYKLSDVYQGLENGVKGGFRCKNNITWFFKGTQFIRVKNVFESNYCFK